MSSSFGKLTEESMKATASYRAWDLGFQGDHVKLTFSRNNSNNSTSIEITYGALHERYMFSDFILMSVRNQADVLSHAIDNLLQSMKAKLMAPPLGDMAKAQLYGSDAIHPMPRTPTLTTMWKEIKSIRAQGGDW